MIAIRHATKEDMDLHRPGDYTGWNEPLVRHARTIVGRDHEVLAVVGVGQRWSGVGDIWAIFTDDARGYGVALYRECVGLLDMLQNELNMPRLNAWVRADSVEYKRWAEMCGFVPESFMPGGGPDNTDLVGYVRCRDQVHQKHQQPRCRPDLQRKISEPSATRTAETSGTSTSSSSATSRSGTRLH